MKNDVSIIWWKKDIIKGKKGSFMELFYETGNDVRMEVVEMQMFRRTYVVCNVRLGQIN